MDAGAGARVAGEEGVARNVVNCPLPAGAGARGARRALEDKILPALAAFRPALVLISLGLDALDADPIGGLRLDPADYGWITEAVAKAAPGAGLVSVLEGGYDLPAIARAVRAAGVPFFFFSFPRSDAARAVGHGARARARRPREPGGRGRAAAAVAVGQQRRVLGQRPGVRRGRRRRRRGHAQARGVARQPRARGAPAAPRPPRIPQGAPFADAPPPGLRLAGAATPAAGAAALTTAREAARTSGGGGA